jgi:hypothetical protein
MKYLFSLACIMLAVFVYSCNGEQGNKELAALADTTSFTGISGNMVKLVKTASVNIKVKNVEQSARSVSALARKFGGMVYNANIQSQEDGRKECKISNDSLMIVTSISPRAEITARVPSASLEDFVFSAADLGYFTESSRLDIDDKSLTYLENILKEKNRKDVLAASSLKKNSIAATEKTIAIKDDVTDREISNRTITADANYSMVTLALYQNPLIRKETIANYVVSDYEPGTGYRFLNATKEGWQYFLGFVLVLAHLWVFILVALLSFITYRYYNHKRKMIVVKAG